MPSAPVRKAPYKDFLQPVLQRRFSSTAAVLLAVAYVEAVFFASWNSYFWSWFPLGPAAFRTALIFACGLPILVLRIAHYHVGLRTTGSGWQVLVASLGTLQCYETAFWYGLSSAFFLPIFLSAAPSSANLRWINYMSGDRARVNERPIFLACYLGTCALVQTAYHYGHDIDRLVMGSRKKAGATKNTKTIGSLQEAVALVPSIFGDCARRAVETLLVALCLYYGFLRHFAWSWTVTFWRTFYSLPKTSLPPHTWPVDVWFLWRCLYAGTFLCLIWAAENAAFSMFMVKEPLKNCKPLTSESKDPNGSLLNGLKSKKQSIKAFALWELAHIATDFDTRRQAIYQDIDRKDGPMWSQVYKICMDTVKSIETRIDNYNKPPAPAPAPPPATVDPKQRVSAPLREDPILKAKSKSNTARDGVEKAVGHIARSPGSSPVSKLSPIAKKTWNDAKDRLLSREQQKALSQSELVGKFEQNAAALMSLSFMRKMFERAFRKEFAGAALGTPYAEPAMYVNAIVALTQLAVHSLSEDQFGNVHRDVPSILRNLTALVRKLESFRAKFPVHWTDTRGTRQSPEADAVLDAAKAGLLEVVDNFEPYMADLRLTLTDIRLAKEAASKAQ